MYFVSYKMTLLTTTIEIFILMSIESLIDTVSEPIILGG